MKYITTHKFAALLASAMTIAGTNVAIGQNTNTRPEVGEPAVVISHPPIRNGSNAARAPLPVHRPFEYERVTDDGGIPSDAKVVANHIGSPTAEQIAANMTPSTATGPAYATTIVTQTPGLAPTGQTSATMSLDAARVAPTIRVASFSNREQVLSDIETRIATVSATAGTAAKEKERALRASIQNARSASAQEWENARAKVAADYEAYAQALASSAR